MLNEINHVRQIEGEPKRRWFNSSTMDLIVWLDEQNRPSQFELCYDKTLREKSLRCSPNGAAHTAVDGGENKPGKYKATPMLGKASEYDLERLKSLFEAESARLPGDIKAFVGGLLAQQVVG